jgi:DNA-binding response OmpR family regulator
VDISVLIVEENDAIRRVLRDWLETVLSGLCVIEAANGEKAIALARARPPRVILITVDPPRTNSVKTIQRIKTAAPSVEIVALAMNGQTIYRDEIASAGASAYVSIWKMHGELLPTLQTLLAAEKENKTVVCIEDEPDMLKLIQLAFRNSKFKLIGALDGREGLRVIQRVKPALVLLDLMMPEVDGWQVYQQMKADDEMRNIPIIVVTALEQNSDVIRDLQVYDYVRKPFLPWELVQRVSMALDLAT